MWRFFYDVILQLLVVSWAQYRKMNNEAAIQVRDAFRDYIYRHCGLVLILFTLASCFVYYFYMNRRFGGYHRLSDYFKWMTITASIVSLITLWIARSYVAQYTAPTWGFCSWLAAVNFTYSLILFFVVSVICQVVSIMVRRLFSLDISPMGNRTPF
jgi:hypothetical protein